MGDGQFFFRPSDVELVSEGDGISGRVTSHRRLAGTRIIEVDVGTAQAPNHVEIEVPLEAAADRGAVVKFRPVRWKIFGNE